MFVHLHPAACNYVVEQFVYGDDRCLCCLHTCRPPLLTWCAGTEDPSRGGPSPFTSIRECLEVDPLLAVVTRNNDALLAAEGGGRNTLISRLVAVVKVGGTACALHTMFGGHLTVSGPAVVACQACCSHLTGHACCQRLTQRAARPSSDTDITHQSRSLRVLLVVAAAGPCC